MAQLSQHCVNHPRRATRVSCAACGQPICTDCMRETPVGMKCPSCARISLHARALGTPKQYVTAAGAGLLAATTLGAFVTIAHIGVFGIIPAILIGLAVGKAVAWGAHGHRHGGFMAIAAATTVLGLAIGELLTAPRLGGAVLPASLIGLVLAGMAAAWMVGH
ncbi:MAG TPA: hypothetical protein VET24_13845 [Actinomycetota bacterium]|nr:hypothetical protein [Actinomycetota bacterium]